jgi:hypothetical protein
LKVQGFCTRQDFHRRIGGSNWTPSDGGEENFVLCPQQLFGQISLLVPTYMHRQFALTISTSANDLRGNCNAHLAFWGKVSGLTQGLQHFVH